MLRGGNSPARTLQFSRPADSLPASYPVLLFKLSVGPLAASRLGTAQGFGTVQGAITWQV